MNDTLTLPSLSLLAAGQLAGDFRFNFGVFSAVRQKLHGRTAPAPVTVLTRADFIHHVLLHLPEIAARIEDDDFGLLHLEVAAMKLATQDAIARYELHTVRRHFAFISYLLDHADRALHDAITVSYVEALFLENAEPECLTARRLLPANLENALQRAELHFRLLDRKFCRRAAPRGAARPHSAGMGR